MAGTRPDLTRQVAVVTGAGSGIGRATARLLAQLGATVHAADLDLAAAQAVAGEIEAAGGRARAHGVDVADPAAVEALAERVYAQDGRVDLLHNNAGVGHAGEIEHTTVGDWQRVVGVNLLGTAYGVQAFVPRMLAQGGRAHIVNTASGLGLVAAARMAPYVASKFGVVGMTEALNAELSPRGIHVSAVCPGIVDTAIARTSTLRGETAAQQAKAVDFYARRGASPDTVAQAVVDAVVHRRLIQPVPRAQVTPGWLLHRLSPRLTQLVAQRLVGLMTR